MTELGENSTLLWTEIIRNPQDGTISMFQGKQARNMLERFGMLGKIKLTTFWDTSFDTSERIVYESVTGVIVILSSGPILHRSMIQQTICGSSTEAELVATY